MNALVLSYNSSVRVEFVHQLFVDEGVSASGLDLIVDLLGAHNSLNFLRVDQTSDVGVGADGMGNFKVLLGGSLGESSVDAVQSGESVLGPDDEAAERATGSELKQVLDEKRCTDRHRGCCGKPW